MIDKTNINEEVKIDKILVATDGSPTSLKGIVHAVQMAKEKNAELIALHVDSVFIDADPTGYLIYADPDVAEKIAEPKKIKDVDPTGYLIYAGLDKYYKDVGKPKSLILGEAGLEVAASLGKKKGVKVKTMVERGRAAETILRIAKEESVDMIVMGSKGLTGLDKILMGSVADRVSDLASCSVLIIK